MTTIIKNKLLDSNGIKNILLDFDGTLTDVDAEAMPAIEKWHELYCEKTGVSRFVLDKDFSCTLNEVLNDSKSGWINDGFIVAPATADPLVLTTTVYQKMIAKNIREGSFPSNPEAKAIDALLYELFSKSYPYSNIVFRKGAKEFLDELTSQYNVTIVTNSKVDSVEHKLGKLVDYSVPIIGNAKKYIIGTEPSFIPKQTTLEDFPRPIFLRRSQYYSILKEFDAEESAVIGDIYEFDLALPEYLGFKTIQLETSTTPRYESNRKNTSNYKLSKNYSTILGMIEK